MDEKKKISDIEEAASALIANAEEISADKPKTEPKAVKVESKETFGKYT